MRHSCSAEKKNELSASRRTVASVATSASARKGPRALIGRFGSRSASFSARMDCAATAVSTHSPATARAPRRHPPSSTSGGTTMPASAPPSGTPVCFTENTKDIMCGGVVFARMCELAGVIGP